ncbi:hypothetical protein, partial [Paenibacillus xylanexedens]|uniref:hypothetical protein n=1 Tax=Paenibacillus xylanexedens TaxID=528191 RepID=UPI001C92C5BB
MEKKIGFECEWGGLCGGIFDGFGIRVGEGRIRWNDMERVISWAGLLRRGGFRGSGVGLEGG